MVLKTIRTDRLISEVYTNRKEMGKAAGTAAARAIDAVLAEKETANVIFAAAPSQNEMLESLLKENIDFTRVNAFHMDEYVGLHIEDQQSFARYLTDHIFEKTVFHSVHLISDAKTGESACEEYAKLLLDNPPDVVLMGIGENGHIAFNDPAVADFHDSKIIKRVELDEICRNQQVHDKCFETLEQVPKYALTLTIPTLLSAKYIICTVPGTNKAKAVKEMLTGPIGEHCPATALRMHERAEMFMDVESADEVI